MVKGALKVIERTHECPSPAHSKPAPNADAQGRRDHIDYPDKRQPQLPAGGAMLAVGNLILVRPLCTRKATAKRSAQ
jgi:hypothetical protein